MVLQTQVRGQNDSVYFVKNLGERDQIIKLKLHDKILEKVVLNDVFEL